MNKIELEQLLQYTVWLSIKGFENYQISICGKVRNVTTKRILKNNMNKYGYYYVALYNNGQQKKFKVHRLIAIHFLPNIENKTCVDHINNLKTDNRISNLRWSTIQQNNFNYSLSKKNTSGVRGVIWFKETKKWRAQIKINNKSIHLGYFVNIEDAKLARQNKSAELFGEFQNECEK